VSPLRIGTWAAALVAGPPLWLEVSDGDLSSGGAAVRAVIVALACAVGASFVLGLVSDYDAEAKRVEDKYLAKALLDQLKADAQRQAKVAADAAAGPGSGQASGQAPR
jgi:hypothetical protein